MHNKDFTHTHGFTLVEIIVSVLLLSILTLGSFRTFHHVLASANSNLVMFQQHQLEQQIHVINELNDTYLNISAEAEFDHLNCLIELKTACP